MSYIHNIIKSFVSKLITKTIRFLLKFTGHITRMNCYKINLNNNSFTENNILTEYEPKDILNKYNWLIRKFEDPTILPLGIMHHAYIFDNENDIKIVEYGCETELKKDASIQMVELNDFLKDSLNNEFYIFKYDKEHQNDDENIKTITWNRIGENKYNFLTNTCEDLCANALIKKQYQNQYQNQIKYLLQYTLFNKEKFYKEKTDIDLLMLKKFIPCRYNKTTNKIIVYKNPL